MPHLGPFYSGFYTEFRVTHRTSRLKSFLDIHSFAVHTENRVSYRKSRFISFLDLHSFAFHNTQYRKSRFTSFPGIHNLAFLTQFWAILLNYILIFNLIGTVGLRLRSHGYIIRGCKVGHGLAMTDAGIFTF